MARVAKGAIAPEMSIPQSSLVDLKALKKDIKAALIAAPMGDAEVRYLVDTYYQMQDFRKRSSQQTTEQAKIDEPHLAISLVREQFALFEEAVKAGLGIFSANSKIGSWSMQVIGIGPVLSAGLLAHIDINKAPGASHIWRFAGLDPTIEWAKGEKRPWNASLKTLCWLIGESFVKVSGNENSLYGRLYRERKELEISMNEAGLFADQAEAKLNKFKIGKDTDAYKAYSIGKLPPAHIHSRAKRRAVKIFLAHWHAQAYRVNFNKKEPVPWVIEHGGHVHLIEPEVPYSAI